jgi:hypothetical protein
MRNCEVQSSEVREIARRIVQRAGARVGVGPALAVGSGEQHGKPSDSVVVVAEQPGFTTLRYKS